MKELIEHTEMTLGPVDILVNCAGVMYYTMMKNLHEDEWERQIDVNVKVQYCNITVFRLRNNLIKIYTVSDYQFCIFKKHVC